MEQFLIRGGEPAGFGAPAGLPTLALAPMAGTRQVAASLRQCGRLEVGGWRLEQVGGPPTASDGPSTSGQQPKTEAKLTGASVKDAITWLGWEPEPGTYFSLMEEDE
jgi:hypothetical protein